MKFYYFLLVLATSNTYASTSPANVPLSPTSAPHIPFAQVRFDATEPLPTTSLYAITQHYKKQQAQKVVTNSKRPAKKTKQQI